MSYQLIYTSAAELLEPGIAGYGVVACSADIPKTLYRRLLDISDLREPAGKGIMGPQYTYHLLEITGQTYHVLSCLQPAGADYSGRGCHIAHHLALSQEEAHAMASHTLRPTPAGMILALRQAGFWRSSWEGSPQYLHGEPNLTPSMLPDASTQTNWKQLTGHKRNARVLNLPPYDRACLIAVPEGIASATLLGLLHESDWILSSCGWGKSFTTYASPEDSFRDTQRMFSSMGSALEERVRRSGRPVLPINSLLPVFPAGMPDHQTDQEKLISRPTSNGESGDMIRHYRYVEPADDDIYWIPERKKIWRWAAPIAGVILAAVGGVLWPLLMEPEDTPIPQPPTQQPAPKPEPLPDLASLLLAPLSDEQLEPLLEQWNDWLCTQIKKQPSAETAVKQEVVSLLLLAPTSSHHAADLQRLCEHARIINFPKESLCLLYMNRAYQSGTAEFLAANCSPESQGAWAQLQRLEPELVQGLIQSNHLTPYFRLIFSEREGNKQATAQEKELTPPIVSEPLSSPVVPAQALSPGWPLPVSFEALIRRLPLTIDSGDYTVCRWGRNTGKPTVETYHLSPGRNHLLLEAGKKAGLYQITLIQEGGEEKAPVRFLVKDKVLSRMEQEGEAVAISIPLPSHDGKTVAPLVMVSRLQFFLKRKEPPLPPVLLRAPVLIEPQYIEIIRKKNRIPRLCYQAPAQLPWCPYHQDLKDIDPLITVRLPQLVPAGNFVEAAQSGNAPEQSFVWTLKLSPHQSRANWEWYHCLVCRDYDFSSLLHSQFDRIANTACFGDEPEGDPCYSLAHLYSLVDILGNPSTSKKEWHKAAQHYIQILDNKKFASLLSFLLLKEPQLVPHQKISGNVRSLLLQKLNEPETRAYILQELRSELQTKLEKVYRQALEKQMRVKEVPLLLELDRLSTSAEGSLIWRFTLTPDTIRS